MKFFEAVLFRCSTEKFDTCCTCCVVWIELFFRTNFTSILIESETLKLVWRCFGWAGLEDVCGGWPTFGGFPKDTSDRAILQQKLTEETFEGLIFVNMTYPLHNLRPSKLKNIRSHHLFGLRLIPIIYRTQHVCLAHPTHMNIVVLYCHCASELFATSILLYPHYTQDALLSFASIYNTISCEETG